VLAGKNKATEIGNILRSKVLYLEEKPNKTELVINSDITKRNRYLFRENTLPTERDVSDYSKYLTLKYGGTASNVEKGNKLKKLKHR